MFESRFQTFEDESDLTMASGRLARLREELSQRGLDGFLVPRSDEHQNEYVPPCAERLAWLTGFTGSAGMAVALRDRAAIFVDGRYTIQVRQQVDTKSFEPLNSGEISAHAWLERQVQPGWRIAYDPWLLTPAQVARFEQAVTTAGGSFVPVDNIVDAIWHDRPQAPLGALTLHPARLAGETAASKLKRVNAALGKADGFVLSDPHAVAWLFNIRGSDVAHTPIPLCFALLRRDGQPTLYVDDRKISDSVREAISALAAIEPPARLVADLAQLGAAHATLRFDSATAPARLVQALESAGGKAECGADPIALMKARKNRAELRGAQAAHVRDGAAMAQFLAWFAAEAPGGRLTEIDAVKALETFRRGTKRLRDVSFPTISGAGSNGAIVHYRVTDASNRKIGRGLFLLDSGAQYEDGTTDITRTIAVGKPTAEMRDRFTRVLKGHIGIATSVFPKGTSGAQLDSFARRPLWDAGLDFDHGTGHGVGAYLSVHEGPQRISKLGSVALEEGMILSNEPGYYKAGAYGIRIENLIVVEARAVAGAERAMLGFCTLTLAPIDLSLVDTRLLSPQEIAWLNAYHARVRREISPLVDAPTRKWLAGATKALGKP